MTKLPKLHQRVEILLDDRWVPATFVGADSVDCGSDDELWWMDYFLLDDHSTIPDDIHSGDKLPAWRPI